MILFHILFFNIKPGICSVSSCYMVSTTITKHSGIIKDNIMTHIGHASLTLDTIAKGSGYHLSIAALFFLIVSLVFFVWNCKKTKSGLETSSEHQDYRLLMTEHP